MIVYRATYQLTINRKLYSLLLLASFLFGFGMAIKLYGPQDKPYALPYTYEKLTAPGRIVLHTIRTTPDNITLKAIDSNVTETGQYGINGGFFWEGYLLSIAVMGDQPLKGKQGDYGSGWYNIDYRKGTLVWDDAAKQFSVQVVQSADELKVTDRSRFWAQGGVSMSLTRDELWVDEALAEDMPAFDEKRLRSAVVYDREGYVYMIVSETKCTVEEFRKAIRQTVAPGHLIDGVFLDGDGSSQLLCREAELKGDTRQVYQMMALKNTNPL
ncbi:hypothetical protein [Paenibacillus hamazuiensis]|uniref:hypothetical protein n=1 Tax=Paenibacillus hamazuiensis TaxID=2936508 RepID=UPI00200CCB8C|nr:hypothetical protein [Paenibacillus hamazuiensis]